MIAAWFRSKLTLTRTIVAVNIGLALISWALTHFGRADGTSDFIRQYFPLNYHDLNHGKLWELWSYMWVHAPLQGIWSLHLIFNMVTLAAFGRLVEERLGPRNLALIYFGGGFFAALCALLEMSVREMIGAPGTFILVGASGAVLAVVAAFAWIYPEDKLWVLPVPVPIQARKVICWLLVISWLLLLAWPDSFISHATHIGGLVWGLFFMWSMEHPISMWRRKSRFKRRGEPEGFEEGFDDSIEGWEEGRLRIEADRVLEKIHRFGIESLTPQEKSILDRARYLL